MEEYDYLFKVIIIGDSNVGKSSLMVKFTTKHYKGAQYDPTIGVEFGSKLLDLQGRQIKLQIWDTAGQESFRSLTRSYYRCSVGALLVFDLASKESFVNVQKWVDETRHYGYEKISYILVGNKSDLKKEQILNIQSRRQVQQEQVDAFLENNPMPFVQTSAKLGTNVEECFQQLAQMVIDKIEKGELDPVNEVNCGVKVGLKENRVDYAQISARLGQRPPKGACC